MDSGIIFMIIIIYFYYYYYCCCYCYCYFIIIIIIIVCLHKTSKEDNKIDQLHSTHKIFEAPLAQGNGANGILIGR